VKTPRHALARLVHPRAGRWRTNAAAARSASPDGRHLYQIGKTLFDQLAPPEIKEQYEFPSKEQWDEFAARLQHALESNDLTALGAYVARGEIGAHGAAHDSRLRDYADWLEQRLDEITVARDLTAPPGQT